MGKVAISLNDHQIATNLSALVQKLKKKHFAKYQYTLHSLCQNPYTIQSAIAENIIPRKLNEIQDVIEMSLQQRGPGSGAHLCR